MPTSPQDAPYPVPPHAALHELEYVIVDVETTGCSHACADRVTEVAAVIVRDRRQVAEYSSLINPGRAIPSMITRLTGISNEMVADAPAFHEVAETISSMLESRVFVAHNAAFDWGFLTAELLRATGRPLAGDRLCTVKLARRLLPQLPRRNLDAVTAHFGVHVEARHRALGDAVATARVFSLMLDELGRRGVHTWQELGALLKGRVQRRTSLPRSMTDWRIA